MSAPLTRTEQFPTAAPLDVVLDLHAADLHAVAEPDRTQIEVEITVSGNRATEVFEQIAVTLTGDRLDIQVPRAGWFGIASRIRIRALLPAGSRVRGGGGSGDITLDGSYAAVQVRSGSGDLRLEHAEAADLASGSGDVVISWAGTASARSGSGDVTLRRVGQAKARSGSGDLLVEAVETIDAKTGSGTIVLEGVVSQAVVTSGSGSVRLAELTGEGRLRSSSGKVVIDRLRSGRLDAGSSSGSVRIGVPFGTAVQVDADSRSGRVRSELGAVPDGSGHELTAVVVARSSSGDITLSRAV